MKTNCVNYSISKEHAFGELAYMYVSYPPTNIPAQGSYYLLVKDDWGKKLCEKGNYYSPVTGGVTIFRSITTAESLFTD